ncbi:MAG: hypothetical protein R3195_10045 [Gemmatimonadota bacterium]|nr:hypothetical protein [Gemmatimonadota bacterium]
MNETSRPGLGRSLAELVIIFVGVSAAFFVENYRDDRQDLQALDQAVDGILFELDHYRDGSARHADGIAASLEQWETEAAAGRRAVPAHYTIPGALRPPAPAWETAVAGGVANLLEPSIRMDLGWYYNEFLGIHQNYVRRVEFAEREIFPLERLGPDAFYGDGGDLLPRFAVHMDLLRRFETDLRESARWADSLHDVLTETRGR